jgi:hypothetical protein
MAHESVLSFNQVATLTGNRFGKTDTTCPLCSAARSTAAHRKAKVFRVYREMPDFLTFHCVHCNESGWLRSGDATPIDQEQVKRLRKEAEQRAAKEIAQQSKKAKALWGKSKPTEGTIAEPYIHTARGISCDLPATLRFLRAWGPFHPALIAAYGMPDEVEAGHVHAVQLTFLAPDGLSKVANADGHKKLSLGPSLGLPIVIPAKSDEPTLGITEGIEKALKIHEATGFEVWVSTGATKLPKLAAAIPSRIKSTIIFGDRGEDGELFADELARAMCGRFEVKVLFPRRAA